VLILLTNDDGIHSAGLQALADQLQSLGRVVIVAPDRERSAIGHALTLHAPLRAEEISKDHWAVSGTPTDAVSLGIGALLKEKPDLVISGINKGGNMGDDLTYSGTVAAAMEATLMGVPAIAVSLAAQSFKYDDFANAARIAKQLGVTVLEHGLPSDTFLNINVPDQKPLGIQLTRQGNGFTKMLWLKIKIQGGALTTGSVLANLVSRTWKERTFMLCSTVMYLSLHCTSI